MNDSMIQIYLIKGIMLGNNEIDNNAYNYGTNTIGLLHIVEKKITPFCSEFTKGILGDVTA